MLKCLLGRDELGRQIMKKLFGLIEKTYSYLKDNNGEDKKSKTYKKVWNKIILNFEIMKIVSKQLRLKIKQTI